MFLAENIKGIQAIWLQIADLEIKRKYILPYDPVFARGIGRKILRRSEVLAQLIANDMVQRGKLD